MHTPPDPDQIHALIAQLSALTHKEVDLTAVNLRSQAFSAYLSRARPLMQLWTEVTQSLQNDRAGQLRALTAIRRYADQVTVPANLETAHQYLLAAMDAVLQATAAFPTAEDTARESAQTYLVSIKAYHRELRRELEQIMALLAAAIPPR